MPVAFQRLVSWLQHRLDSAKLSSRLGSRLQDSLGLVQGPLGRSLISRRGVKRGDDVLLVPLQCLLYVREDVPAASEPSLLAALVASERRRSLESPWAPYLDFLPKCHSQLPRHFDPSFFSEHLSGSLFQEFVDYRRQECRSEFDRLRTLGSKYDDVSWSEFSWAWDILDSRATSLPVAGSDRALRTVLFPLADLAQHSDIPNIACDFDPDVGALRCTATGDIRAGEEILNSYFGLEMSSWETFERWGFVSERSSSKSVSFRVDVSVLQDLQRRVAAETNKSITDFSRATMELFADLQAGNVDTGKAFLSHLSTLSGADDVSAALLGCHVLRHVLHRYPQSLHEDELIINNAQQAAQFESDRWGALIVRRDEKMALHWWLAHLESTVGPKVLT
eukprot:TRINITY_DN28088_c0_g1_i1.p1 TRINITY_DN28088_c0_g1~~TRINITY_DN28088_c0_g1_i1.p1  ORF type:complete len:393 (+),score=46.46 TRINITY_DN28088_c0_g1_i1:42-1220(+)